MVSIANPGLSKAAPDPGLPSSGGAVGHRKVTPASKLGRLIVLEGLDGAGTTTQARHLVERLGERGHLAHLTREPSDNPIGRLLREFLIGGHALPVGEIRQETFALLFAADRLDHVQREVEPQIAAGKIVVSDRWYHSSFAYQGQGGWQGGGYRTFDPDKYAWIAALNQHALQPDLTIFLQVTPEVAAERRVAARRTQELFEDLDTQRRVDATYRATLELLRKRGERVEVLDGEQAVEAVGAQILRLVTEEA
jgi:dTMP kinase